MTGQQMKLHYRGPAADWKQGLPLGNGRLGAVIQSGYRQEIWSLSEVTYWSGKTERTASASQGRSDLDAMRDQFFAGSYAAGEEMAGRWLQSEKGNFGTNLPMADLTLTFDGQGEDMIRELDLEQALHRVTYRSGEQTWHREMLISHPDQVLAARLWSGQPGGIAFTLALTGRTNSFETRVAADDTLQFKGQALETMHSDGQCGVSCEGRVKVRIRGGTVRGTGQSIVVTGADEAWIELAVHTDYGRIDEAWKQTAEELLAQAMAKGYEAIRADHIADYRQLYARVKIALGGLDDEAEHAAAQQPTDIRMQRLREGGSDAGLFALFYQYGRYLTIAGTRADSPLPLHLQGLWNDGEANRMAWSCDYHLDINTEMNYYPTEAANLAECHLPLLRYIERLAEAGRQTAQDFYGCEGWTAHVFSNAWGFTAPGWHYSWGLNVTGGLWIANQLREHYEYNLSETFLREQAYPVLRESAVFFLAYMVVHPQTGWLVTGPSNSPENSFYPAGQQTAYALSMGPTLDQALIRDLFVFCLSAAEQLGMDEALRTRLQAALPLLPPLQIGAKGQLQEWLEDYGEAQPDHRHLSHLYSLYPGHQVTPEATPALSEAARTTLAARLREDGLEDVEFTLALFAANYARLGDGEGAYTPLSYLIGQLCFDNLLTYSKGGIAGAETNIFVADGNFGGTAAIGEMLLQSQPGDIRLLPALPACWPSGTVSGLRAKGHAEVELDWTAGELVEATVHAYAAGAIRLHYGNRIVELLLEAGHSYRINAALEIEATSHS